MSEAFSYMRGEKRALTKNGQGWVGSSTSRDPVLPQRGWVSSLSAIISFSFMDAPASGYHGVNQRKHNSQLV